MLPVLYPFVDLLSLHSLPEIGKKAESLIELLRQGAPVPPGASLSSAALHQFLEQPALKSEVEAFLAGALDTVPLQDAIRQAPLPEALQAELRNFLSQHPGQRWAVRSSGVQEDLADASFAGLYTTVLNVSGQEAIEAALRECWSSLFGERVQAYAERHGIAMDQMQMGVILQAMIPAEKSGVLFSVHPLTGRDTQMLTEAVPGLGEALVSGGLTPDSYVYDWFKDELIESQIHTQERCLRPLDAAPFTHWQDLSETEGQAAVLSPAELRELGQLALHIQVKCGFPIDLEWVQYQGKFYIVQRRPITRLHYQGIEGEWTTADFKDGGVSSDVCTPYMWSLYDYIWEQTMPNYLRKTHLLASESEQALWGDIFFARPYWNVGAVKAGLKGLPGFVEREFDEDLGIEVTYEGRGHVTPTNLKTLGQGLKVLGALKKAFAQRKAHNQLFLPRIQARLAELATIELGNLDDNSLSEHFSQLVLEDYFQAEGSYFYHIFDNSNVTTLFKDQFKPYKNKINYLALISGLRDLSHLRQNFELWTLSRQIRAQREALKYWRETPVANLMTDWQTQAEQPFMPEMQAYIQHFQHHSTRELDITVPRYGEDPSFVFESLKNLLDLEDRLDPRQLNEKQHQEYLREREKLLQAAPFFKRKSLGKAVDQLRDFLWWREELRDHSTQMYAQIRRFTLEVGQRLQAQGKIQASEDVFFLKMSELLELLERTWSAAEARREIQRQRQYYQSFRRFRNPNEIGSRYTGHEKTAVSGSDLSGIPCSPGRITATARVIQDIRDAERIQAGDILITRFTDPGWTPKFGLLAGVATETGGLLSHAAVISREYGIPAVLAIPGLMERVQDGQKICLDGDQGRIELNPTAVT